MVPDHRGTQVGQVGGHIGTGDGFGSPVSSSVSPSKTLKPSRRLTGERVTVTNVTKLRFTESSAFSALTYVAPAENEFDAGVFGWTEMTDIIRGATGPSGSNLNYVAKLHETLMSHEIIDPYVNQLMAHLNSAAP